MKLTPVLTEKSLGLAGKGQYTFLVDVGASKGEIKKAVEGVFGVSVTKIRTIRTRPISRKNLRGRKVYKKAIKKALVTLKKDEKIDLFEEKK
jgi:large subunit ribosomal protein L23